ncbi:MAG: heme-binding protein [Methyloversatilis sp.]|jgi:glc operon protein GlcG|uniref:GlcG protein n=1 Tax=Methyloversatilis universalis (strain ATCC BAA-1314 / DSM 25237 / JCM 13912 / CCUG 52030 / FAM5) TaxID=1000565 RepID=F5RG52_METUF|nr:heme-binding protein [Methyloversatilis universalis]EGK70540.1 Putative GlcG protein [Methyloversatilis universalis FAM5]MCP4638750.1 heme-binding protein [Methyloversatilis sp.]
MKTRLTLTLDDAKQIAAAAEAEALKRNWPVTIAIVDDGGNLIWLQRLDGAPPMSTQIAPEKARTCALARKPSKAVEDVVNSGRLAALRMPVLPLEGGEMIIVNGECVGGVGVSGVKSSEDAIVARAGIAAIGASWDMPL